MKNILLLILAFISTVVSAQRHDRNQPESILIPLEIFQKWIPTMDMAGDWPVSKEPLEELPFYLSDTIDFKNGFCIINQRDTIDCQIMGYLPSAESKAKYNLVIADVVYILTWKQDNISIEYNSIEQYWIQHLKPSRSANKK